MNPAQVFRLWHSMLLFAVATGNYEAAMQIAQDGLTSVAMKNLALGINPQPQVYR